MRHRVDLLDPEPSLFDLQLATSHIECRYLKRIKPRGFKRFPYKKVEDKIQKKEEDNPTGRGTRQSIQMGKVVRHFKGGKEIPRVEKREHSPQISKAREAENRARGTQEG